MASISSGASGSTIGEKRMITARGYRCTLTAHEVDAYSLANAVGGAQKHATDLPGGAQVRTSAGVQVIVSNLHQAHAPSTLRQLAQTSLGEQHLRSFPAYRGGGDHAIFSDKPVCQPLHSLQISRCKRIGGKVDCRTLFSQVEGYGHRLQLSRKHGR